MICIVLAICHKSFFTGRLFTNMHIQQSTKTQFSVLIKSIFPILVEMNDDEKNELNTDDEYGNTKRAPWYVEHFILCYDAIVEIAIIYIPFLSVPIALGWVQKEEEKEDVNGILLHSDGANLFFMCSDSESSLHELLSEALI